MVALSARAWTRLYLVASALTCQACAAERLVEREVLSDPLMRMTRETVLEPPGGRPALPALLPADSLRLQIAAGGDPGQDGRAAALEAGLRAAVELAAGFGLEAGYGTAWGRERLLKLDGFAGPILQERVEHGPDAALVYDDGTSLLRVGYRYRTGWDGDRHEPGVSARSQVLGRDTMVELGYLRSGRAIEVGLADLPAAGQALSESRTADCFLAALEQGFLPGVTLRLDLEARLERGYLENPYRLVSLWSHRGLPAGSPEAAPRVLPENHPDTRARFGALLRARFLIPAWGGALELGAGYGTGTWRVEHARASLGYHQRLGDLAQLWLEGGAYHQIRASFYRDDYPDGPPGSHWTAERDLSAFLAAWGRAGLTLTFLPVEGRLLGMFRALHLGLQVQAIWADYGFEDPPNGFSAFDALAGAERRAFRGGLGLGGGLSLEAEF